MKKIDLILKIALSVVLVSAIVVSIIAGQHLIAWIINAVLYSYMLWRMFSLLCKKLDIIARTVNAILHDELKKDGENANENTAQ